ncbi:hypothetical protein KP79_PYT24530 [Mizuhopecten yessoensis]|uniref:Uncharacterized protein n=1 Tax=Mizuhopecten yessoensis TaxID=6573 RepID=A0A210Q2F0_MIZYE|nr:hypothetical protein KP79_PYT24530 [Mizuhopecten yessoensis]
MDSRRGIDFLETRERLNAVTDSNAVHSDSMTDAVNCRWSGTHIHSQSTHVIDTSGLLTEWVFRRRAGSS